MDYQIVVDKLGNKYWYLNEIPHREGGPAVENSDGTKEWWVNGALHREDGPAIEHLDGYKQWFLNGKKLTKESWFEKLPVDSKIKALFSEHFIGNR